MLLVALFACGPEVGEKVASTEAGEIVVAGVDWPTRYLAALQSTRGAQVSQSVMSDLRKIGGKVLVDQATDFSGIDKDTPLLDLVREQAQETHWRPTVALDQWAFESGFKDVSDVRYELVRSRLARRATAAALESLTGALFDEPGTGADADR